MLDIIVPSVTGLKQLHQIIKWVVPDEYGIAGLGKIDQMFFAWFTWTL
jgi:hypothetical protein